MKKILLGAGVVAAVSLGSVVFTGGDIIDQVNRKVSGMFEMINQYEENEERLVKKINNLKERRANLVSQVEELTASNKDKDTQISDLNIQITELSRQIELLEQLGNKNELVQEIIRLEGEINKANSKVAELQSILDTQINNAPLTEDEMNELLFSKDEFNGTIYLTNEISDETVVKLSSYAELHIKKIVSTDGPVEFFCTVMSTTYDGFNVEIGTDSVSQSALCHPGQPFVFKQFLGSQFNYTYIKINDGDFVYKLVVE